MIPTRLVSSATALLAAACVRAAEPLSLLDAPLTPSSKLVSHASGPEGLTLTIAPGNEGYPGVTLAPAQPWNLAAYGHVEAHVRNLGAKPVSVNLRIDNDGDWQANPWNAESAYLQPGATGTVKVIFGHSFGFKPAYKLNPAAVPRVCSSRARPRTHPPAFASRRFSPPGPPAKSRPSTPTPSAPRPPAACC